jgi:hypothetical protein
MAGQIVEQQKKMGDGDGEITVHYNHWCLDLASFGQVETFPESYQC